MNAAWPCGLDSGLRTRCSAAAGSSEQVNHSRLRTSGSAAAPEDEHERQQEHAHGETEHEPGGHDAEPPQKSLTLGRTVSGLRQPHLPSGGCGSRCRIGLPSRRRRRPFWWLRPRCRVVSRGHVEVPPLSPAQRFHRKHMAGRGTCGTSPERTSASPWKRLKTAYLLDHWEAHARRSRADRATKVARLGGDRCGWPARESSMQGQLPSDDDGLPHGGCSVRLPLGGWGQRHLA